MVRRTVRKSAKTLADIEQSAREAGMTYGRYVALHGTTKHHNACPNCGANLDPGERCDCKSAARNPDDLLTPANHPQP